ncbi:hypothetical protein FE74_15820, partial [Staphylococcus aureus]
YIKHHQVLAYVLYKPINFVFETFANPDASKNMLEVFQEANVPAYGFPVTLFDQWTLRTVQLYIVYSFYTESCDENGYP